MTHDERNVTYAHLIVQRHGVLDALDAEGWRWDREISLILDRLDAMLTRGKDGR